MYDIIGDAHGHYDLLVKLLNMMGYTQKEKVYRHPKRTAIFIGDFINRGPQIRETVKLIRRMTDSGSALAILGNHEMNAILYSTLDKSGKLIRKQLPRYKLPLMKTLAEYTNYKDEWYETVDWFRTLPLYLKLDGIRIVHGGWNDAYIETFERYKGGENRLKKKLLKEFLINEELNLAMSGLLKGEEFQLPKDIILHDSKGLSHRRFRIKWWESAQGKTFRQAAFGNRFLMPDYSIPDQIVPTVTPYPSDAPPVFIGHYCLDKEEQLVRNNIFCVDSCVARTHKLTAYQWQGEQNLTNEHVVTAF